MSCLAGARRGQRHRPWQSAQNILQDVLTAEFAFLGSITIGIDQVDIRPDPVDLRLNIQVTSPGGDENLADRAEWPGTCRGRSAWFAGDARPLSTGEWWASLPRENIQIAISGGLARKSGCGRRWQPVEAASDDDFFSVWRWKGDLTEGGGNLLSLESGDNPVADPDGGAEITSCRVFTSRVDRPKDQIGLNYPRSGKV